MIYGKTESFNRYTYANNNPMKFVDPDGRDGLFAASWAKLMEGNTSYQFWDPHPESRGYIVERIGGRGAPKCNAFVWDMLTLGGDPPSRMPGGRIPTTRDWLQGKVEGYRLLSSNEFPELGDVVVDKGHMGLYAPLLGGEPGTISASSRIFHLEVVHNEWGFRPENSPKIFRYKGD